MTYALRYRFASRRSSVKFIRWAVLSKGATKHGSRLYVFYIRKMIDERFKHVFRKWILGKDVLLVIHVSYRSRYHFSQSPRLHHIVSVMPKIFRYRFVRSAHFNHVVRIYHIVFSQFLTNK